MKKIIVSVFCFVILILCKAQMVTSYSTDHDKFMKELTEHMTLGKLQANVETMDEFQKMLKDGKISSAWIDQMIITCNAMAARQMAPFPHYNYYLNAVMIAVKSNKTDAEFQGWNKLLVDIIKNQKKGDNSDFVKIVEFSKGFFQQNALSVTPAKTWMVTTNDYKLMYDNNKPYITFPVTNLVGFVKGDTIIVKQTSGDYYPLEYKWIGKSGKVNWLRAGFDPGKVYATFGNYTVNTSNFNYSVDSVTFYQTDYFKTPIKGRLTDKMMTGIDSGNISYPRFESYDMAITIKDISQNVSYTGGFSLWGSKIIGHGSPDAKALLTFYARDGKTRILTAKSQALTIKKGEELGAEKAEVSIYFGADSIFHPQLNLVYKIPKKEIRLLRGETGMGKAKFIDSYHNHEFQTDAIFWNLDSSILNLKILQGAGVKPGIFESVNYFNKELIRKMQGYTSYEPLSIIKKLAEKNGTRELNTIDVAQAINPNLKEGELKSLLYGLVENGFILYNEDIGMITVKDKDLNYVLANAKKIDYDIIHIVSAPKSGNDRIDLKSNNIDLKGVFEIPISDTAYVYFRPKNQEVSLQKDRNMEFDGLIYAGRMDLYGQKNKFQYAPFTVDLTKVDSMVINIPDSNKVDAFNNPVLKPIRSRIEGIKGLLEIDAPINKSGRTKLIQFPRLYSREKSFVYYDDTTVAKGAYKRKDFYFELQPFRLDSLNNFSPDVIKWPGKLVSGGIFPDIQDSAKLQTDASLGFKSETPTGGFELYKGRGRYYGKYQLNYNGLNADGKITHSTAGFITHDARLYPDSMLGSTDSFTISKTFEGVKTPNVKGSSEFINWKPLADSMLITMGAKSEPFQMYDDGNTSFKGSLLLTGKCLKGNGLLDWSEATLASKDFAFRTMDLSADTASLNIKTTGGKVSFKTPNVSAKVSFQTHIGDFVSNQKDIPTEFSYNQYTTAINEFKWYMEEKILDFKAPPQGNGEYFTSIRPDQKGLRFLGKRGIYNLTTSLLRIEQVPEIRVADAMIIPDSGVVIIEEGAKMNQLRNCTIIADTINKAHKIEKAVVDVYSKEELKGFGEYTYQTKNIKEIITLNDISCKKVTEGEHKKAHDEWHLASRATIEESQNFVLYPDVKFSGDVNLVSVDPGLNFKGYAKILFKHSKAATSDFFISQVIKPEKLALKYDTVKSSYGNNLIAGIHLNPSEEGPIMYTTLLAPKQDRKDITLFRAGGLVAQASTGEWLFGNEKKIEEKAPKGSLLTYDDKKGIVKAEGKFNLGTNFGIIKSDAVGNAEGRLDSTKYKFNFTLGIDAKMGDKLQEAFEQHMYLDNSDQPDISYETDKQKKAIYELYDEKEDRKALDDFEKAPSFAKRPKDFDYNLVFSDVNFVYDSEDISLRSVGKIGVAMIGKKVINKKMEGFIEIQYKKGGDHFNIYLKTGSNDWIFLEYRPGNLGIVASYDDMNTLITTLTADKRQIKGDGPKFYLYTLGNTANKQDFVDYMKSKQAGTAAARPEPHPDAPLPVITPVEKPKDVLMLPGDEKGKGKQKAVIPVEKKSEEAMEPKKEKEKKKEKQPSVQDSTATQKPDVPPPPKEKKEKKKKEKPVVDSDKDLDDSLLLVKPVESKPKPKGDLNNLEEMRKNNENILSQPPPDRQKPKEEPKPQPAKGDSVPH